MKSCVVIYNPNSGHTLRKSMISRYKELIEKHGYTATFIATQYKGHAKEIVSHIGYVDLIMSMGGDGTFNEIMCGNFQRKQRLVLAHIPVGTTNDIGVMFGYGKDIEKNIQLCLNGEIKGLDIPLINNRPFVYVAGFGKFLDIPYETPRDLKKKFGHMAYLWAGVKDFFRVTRNYHLTYTIDGVETKGLYSFILISSANRIAGFNNFYKDVKLDDDLFEILFCTYTRRLDIIKAFGMLRATGPNNVSGLEFHRASNIKITFEHHPKKAWCVDGEKLEIRTKTYEIKNEKNVQILMPRRNIEKLFVKKSN